MASIREYFRALREAEESIEDITMKNLLTSLESDEYAEINDISRDKDGNLQVKFTIA